MRNEIFILIVGACGVTVVPRVLPFVLVRSTRIPDWMQNWLQFVPMALMAAILSSDVFSSEETIQISVLNPKVWASVACFLSAVATRNLLLTVVVGVLTVELLHQLG